MSLHLATTGECRVHGGRRLPVGTLVVLFLLLAQRVSAQSGPLGRIEGVVYDSVHARPLGSAHVVAVGTGTQSEVRRDATSDSVGHFHIDSLPPGHYIVGFESALLDSLEVTLSPREANLTAAQVATIDLALPSAPKLRSAVCLGAALPPQSGVIFGHVVSAETESPVAGVVVAMVWRDISVERTKRLRVTASERSDSVITDKDGWYRMCGVPTGAWISMQLRRGDRRGPPLRTRVDDTLGIAVQHLAFSTSSDATADGLTGALLSGTATLTGVVRGAAGTPVASAEVRVLGTRALGRTDESGSFTLRGLPAGTQQLEVRHIGYAIAEVPVALHSETTTAHDVVLQRVVSLDSMVIVATLTKYPDFYAHKSSGFGRFIGPEAIAQMHVTRTSDYFAQIPSFTVRENGSRTLVVSSQGPGSVSGNCVATVVIDGMRVLEYPPTINDIHWTSVAAIEAYPANMAAQAPPEYNIGGCGGIVIWTKR
jgi:hypothetical protein